MATESFLVTALPHSADPAAPFHVSLFITHRLTVDGATGVVADFPVVADWTAQLAGATFTLQGQAPRRRVPTQIPVTPLLDVLEPALWTRVFPAQLPVVSWTVPEHTADPWRSFAAHRMQGHALLAHAAAIHASPVAPPTSARNPLVRALLPFFGYQRGGVRVLDVLGEGDSDRDAFVTRELDAIVDADPLGQLPSEFGGDGGVGALLVDLHRARRYYQRPEEEQEYHERPVPGAVSPAVPTPVPDLHERAARLGDLSPVLRRLGLVVDLRVDDPELLQGLSWLQADVTVPGLANPVTTQPRVWCSSSGRLLTTRTDSGDWDLGMLRLGDEEVFTVLDLDPDASALKLEQYVRNVPRIVAVEANGDGGSSAPAALRATGFAVARRDRAQELQGRVFGARAKDADLLAGTAEPLRLEHVTRGVRLEVWDDTTRAWRSLHARRLDVTVDGTPVLADALDEGFLQAANLSKSDVPFAPQHAHEVLGGWDGWSLATPRPGRTVVHVDGEEQVLDAPPPAPPVDAVAATSRTADGTLPRLRYGRSYAFRAFAVDLAGNARPHALGAAPDGGATPDGLDAAATLTTATTIAETALGALGALDQEATLGPLGGRRPTGLLAAVREGLAATPTEVPPAPPTTLDLTDLAPTGVVDLDRIVVDRLATRAERLRGRGAPRADRVAAAFGAASATSPTLLQRTDAATPPTVLAAALSSGLLTTHGGTAGALGDLLARLRDVVTTPRPFLRWEPLVEPAVVPRHAYTEGESLVRLVVRSGVGADGVPVEAAAYVTDTVAAHPELDLQWRADSQRHLVPPKTSQLEAELHGMFDEAVGSATPAQRRRMLAVALREAGTLLDTTVASLTDPGQRDPQPGVALLTTPTAEVPAVEDPADLPRGDALTPGQYVVHDVDQLVVPYLPDPLATALTLVFPDAGRDARLTGPLAVEGTTLRYAGDWPQRVPYRLVLASGPELTARVDGSVLTVALPPGTQLRTRLSTAVDRESLDLLGLWRSQPDPVRADEVVAQAAADGYLWWLTPATEVVLVHAVPRPVDVPRITLLVPQRVHGDTAVVLVGGVDVHGPSTGRLDVEATWTEWVDDVTKEAPERVPVVAAACGTDVRVDEDVVVLWAEDEDLPLPGGTTLRLHAAVHQMGDTKHRDVDYRVRATTRFREYFSPQLMTSPDDSSLVSAPRRLSVPSTARPPKPVVRDVLPLFRWHEETEPEQPFGLRRTRRSGLRIYLERPWYRSGDGELLAVLLGGLGRGDAGTTGWVSQWGADPVFDQSGPPEHRAALPLLDLLHLTGIDDRREPGRPVGPAVPLPLVDVPGAPSALVLGYEPVWSPARKLWAVDVAFDPGTAFWPFVRLAVARYQPDSKPGIHLSPVTVCDYAQLVPERTATLSRPDDRTARVVVTGAVGVPRVPGGETTPLVLDPALPLLTRVARTRSMTARLERRDPAVGTDLGWQVVAVEQLRPHGTDGTVVTWEGRIALPEAMPPRRPGNEPDWRIVVEESELLPADPVQPGVPHTEARTVYADHLPL